MFSKEQKFGQHCKHFSMGPKLCRLPKWCTNIKKHKHIDNVRGGSLALGINEFFCNLGFGDKSFILNEPYWAKL